MLRGHACRRNPTGLPHRQPVSMYWNLVLSFFFILPNRTDRTHYHSTVVTPVLMDPGVSGSISAGTAGCAFYMFWFFSIFACPTHQIRPSQLAHHVCLIRLAHQPLSPFLSPFFASAARLTGDSRVPPATTSARRLAPSTAACCPLPSTAPHRSPPRSPHPTTAVAIFGF